MRIVFFLFNELFDVPPTTCVTLSQFRICHVPGKCNTRAPDQAVDNSKNPHFLVLLSDTFMEARASLNRPGLTSLGPNLSSTKLDPTAVPISGPPPPTSLPSVNGSLVNRQSIAVGNIAPATVKVEPNTVPPMVSALSHLSGHGAPQGAPALQASSPSPTSQEMVANTDNMQEFKPLVNGMTPPMRPAGPAAANVSILNNLSQVRQVMSSASLTAASSMGLQTMGGTSMAMHMSNMISSGMASSVLPAAQTVFSSGPSGITSVGGSGQLVGTGQVTQNTALGSFTSASSSMSGNPNLGVSPPLGNLQGSLGMGQSVPGMGPGNLSSGSQMGQGGIGMNQNMMNGLGQSGISSGAGTMIPTPGMSQQVQAGLQPLGMNSGSAGNMALPQHASGTMQSQSKYLKVWEGYRSATASEALAADWPPTMQIGRLISQDHMNNNYSSSLYWELEAAFEILCFIAELVAISLIIFDGLTVGSQDDIIFAAVADWCAVIQLPKQTLLLSVSDKASRLIGMLFPGTSSQQQQQQQQQPQQHPQQQMVGTGMAQTFVQGPTGRPQIMSQGQVSSQGPSNMPGSAFLS
ncbi:hypothetical protein ACLOJK_039414 [Asimina triloba]